MIREVNWPHFSGELKQNSRKCIAKVGGILMARTRIPYAPSIKTIIVSMLILALTLVDKAAIYALSGDSHAYHLKKPPAASDNKPPATQTEPQEMKKFPVLPTSAPSAKQNKSSEV